MSDRCAWRCWLRKIRPSSTPWRVLQLQRQLLVTVSPISLLGVWSVKLDRFTIENSFLNVLAFPKQSLYKLVGDIDSPDLRDVRHRRRERKKERKKKGKVKSPKPFSCQLCRKAFSKRRLLEKHLAFHVEENRPCQVCGKVFEKVIESYKNMS